MSALSIAAIVLWAFASGCGGPVRTTTGPGTTPLGDPCAGDMHRCQGLDYQACKNGFFQTVTTCTTAACDPGLGCVACAPRSTVCDGDTVKKCGADGTVGESVVDCVAGGCVSGVCTDPCGHAASEFSYLGCDFFPTVTMNSQLKAAANFAVAVANNGTSDVEVTVSRLGKTQARVTVVAGGIQTINLPWVLELKTATASGMVAGGAFKLSSSGPVTVYQFNPLEFQVRPSCDPTKAADMDCFTYTNDASLLLPVTTLGKHYIAVSRQTQMVQSTVQSFSQYLKGSGFIAVVGTDPARTTVSITFSAPTLAGANGSIKAYKAGQTDTFSVAQGDVLQLLSDAPTTCKPSFSEMSVDTLGNPLQYDYCDLETNDLTGTELLGDHRFAVFSGHDCTFVPYNRWACDHLEEQMLPVESWGKDYLGAHTRRNPATIPDLWRVISAVDGNTISFDPPKVHNPVTLGKGQWVEFPSKTDFEAVGTGAFELVQYMVGQNYLGLGTGGTVGGDPAMAIGVPIEQFRSDYIFLAPDSFKESYVNVTVPANSDVQLDGASIDPLQFFAVGAGKYQAARVPVKAGAHKISSGVPFGITVYGLAPFTAYLYPGGLDVKDINIQ